MDDGFWQYCVQEFYLSGSLTVDLFCRQRCLPSSTVGPGKFEGADMLCPQHGSITALCLRQRLLSHGLLHHSFTLQLQQLVSKVRYKYAA